MRSEEKEFIEDFMAFSCKFCHDIKGFEDCDGRFTKCLDKAVYLAKKMTDKGWKVSSDNSKLF